MLAVLLAGCPSSGLPPPRFPQPDAAAALTLHGLSRAGIASIQAEARVDHRGDDGRVRGTVYMFLQRPARIRYDVMTQFGPVAILTSDGRQFAYSDLRESHYLTGETCPRNIARLLGVPMSVDQTVLLLLGGTPVLQDARSTLEWHRDGFYRIALRAADGQQQRVDLGLHEADGGKPAAQQRLRLLRSELLGADGQPIWRATYDDYQAVEPEGGGPAVDMPFEVRIEQPRSEADVVIRFKGIVLNPQIPPQAFTQGPRPGMKQEVADCER